MNTPEATSARQLDLFDHMLETYVHGGGTLSNASLYRELGERAGIPESVWKEPVDLGPNQPGHSVLKRRVRWWQQGLRQLGLLERDEERGRGFWRITPKGRNKLTPATPGRVLLGFSTDLGIALWGDAADVFVSLDQPIALCLSSLPYPLAKPRAYGNPTAHVYVDWTLRLLEPITKHLMPGGSICLNLSNDIFEPNSPARSDYLERLVIGLKDRLGLWKMALDPWVNPTKPPGPLRWASITKQHLNVGWEPVYIFCNDPVIWMAKNQRVLEPHSERHLAYVRQGGAKKAQSNGDGAYRLYPGSFGHETAGRIPKNVRILPHRCSDKERARKMAIAQGLPVHGATMPLKLAQFYIEYLTERGQMVVDPCAGWLTTARAAELAGRHWACTEMMGEYILGGANRFRTAPGFELFGTFGNMESKHENGIGVDHHAGLIC
ncbi:MAG: DNA methyltransferase [Pseudomonadota bacterium]